jgi:glycosyltransferase involved in cell wall biosynthesis
MRILHLIHTPRHSGAEVSVRELCAIHSSWGHECAIASFAPSQPEFLTDAHVLKNIGVSLFFPESARAKFGRTVQFRRAIVDFQPDAIFAHSVLPSFYGRFAVHRLFGPRGKFVSVLHAANNYGTPGSIFAMAERLTRFLVDRVISVSEEGAENYLRCFGKEIPVNVIKNGIDIKRFSQVDRLEAREKLGLSKDLRVAVQVGRICAVKQQHLSLAALKPLLASKMVQLWFVGLNEDAEYEKKLRQQVNVLGLSQVVRFLGSRSDVPELLAAADLFLMPSKKEAHSVALLEALASGIPVIASDIPAFSFAQTIPGVHICDHLDEYVWEKAVRTMISASRQKRNISKYSIDCTAQNYLDVIEGRL